MDIALWDLAGQERRAAVVPPVPAAPRAAEVPAYASLVRYARVGARCPKRWRRRATRATDAIKLHQIDAESVQVAREGPPARDIPADAGRQLLVGPGRSPGHRPAVRAVPISTGWREPIWPPEDFEALARLEQASGTPIAHRRERLYRLTSSST